MSNMSLETATAILNWDDDDFVDDYEVITPETIEGTSRWNTFYSRVYKHKTEETFWKISWSRGSTEYQDNGYEDITVCQVEPHEKTIIEYRPVKQ